MCKLNTRLFNNVLDGVNENLARERMSNNTNNMYFTICHMLDARYFLANLLGLKEECPYKEIFDAARNIDDLNNYPPLDPIKSHWNEISNLIENRMPDVNEILLQKKPPIDFPLDDNTVLGGITFLLQHESYHIGQLGLMRKYFGLGPMKYD
jgi:uncharacterized damage-inducible protein DinB